MKSAITKIAILRKGKYLSILPGTPAGTRPYKPSSVGFIPTPIDRLHHADQREHHQLAGGGVVASSNGRFQPLSEFLPQIILTLTAAMLGDVDPTVLVRPDVCRPDNLARRAALPTNFIGPFPHVPSGHDLPFCRS